MESLWNKGTTHGLFIRAESLRGSRERVKGVSGGWCVDRAKKNIVVSIQKMRMYCNNSKEHLPNHSETTVARIFAEEPDGCRVDSLRHKGKEKTRCLRTCLIIYDLDGELFTGLQARIKTSRVSAGCGQIHTRVREGTLCHGMSD
jgi:hypothetical protein